MMSDSIGGYFELELTIREGYHKNALFLNTGRNALEYILIANDYEKVYIPYFTCEVVLEPLKKLNIAYEFYRIDENFEPIFNFDKVLEHQVFLYTNYFGIKDEFVKKLHQKISNLIIDNAQSFFSKSLVGIDTFYSARKFFGVPDGAYLYTNKKLDLDLEIDMSSTRFSHLLKRIDSSAEEGYFDFVCNDKSLINNSIKKMSPLTSKILSSINYASIAELRKKNFSYLHKALLKSNKLKFDLDIIGIPMVYPYWATKELRMKLLENKIYTATYWPNVKEWCQDIDLEYKMTDEIIHLPIDQRYGELEMELIINTILNE